MKQALPELLAWDKHCDRTLRNQWKQKETSKISWTRTKTWLAVVFFPYHFVAGPVEAAEVVTSGLAPQSSGRVHLWLAETCSATSHRYDPTKIFSWGTVELSGTQGSRYFGHWKCEISEATLMLRKGRKDNGFCSNKVRLCYYTIINLIFASYLFCFALTPGQQNFLNDKFWRRYLAAHLSNSFRLEKRSLEWLKGMPVTGVSCWTPTMRDDTTRFQSDFKATPVALRVAGKNSAAQHGFRASILMASFDASGSWCSPHRP